MVPELRQVVIDSTKVRVSAEFWRQLLGLVYRPGHEVRRDGEPELDWINLCRPDGSPCLAVQAVDHLPPSTWPAADVPQQLHLDLGVTSAVELDEVHDRLTSLGGKLLLDRSGDTVEPLRVYADPDGHPFCVFVH